jgi:hypothetical protein
MNFASFALLSVGPVLAIVVEAWNPISERMIRKSVEDDLREYEDQHHPQLLDDATKLTVGAVEITGVTPTIISAATTACAIFNEFQKPFFPMLMLFFVVIIGALVIFQLVGGLTFVQIETTRQPYKILGLGEVTLPWTTSQVVSFLIYFANAALIVIAGITSYVAAPAADPSKHSALAAIG